ncbi:helix-turn-helix transcriptional regulator [Bradyrhizobium sp.]|uniref:helix-turn-helix transcriptional regulator n=1 Tax=Bradyrhizobium sp. TaxID=376 RepID=UPI003BAF1877
MSSAVVQFNIIPVRMMTLAEAARHCGRSLTRFKIECPVAPVKFGNGDLRWDVQDLDVWINSLKAGTADHDADAIVARLGA